MRIVIKLEVGRFEDAISSIHVSASLSQLCVPVADCSTEIFLPGYVPRASHSARVVARLRRGTVANPETEQRRSSLWARTTEHIGLTTANGCLNLHHAIPVCQDRHGDVDNESLQVIHEALPGVNGFLEGLIKLS